MTRRFSCRSGSATLPSLNLRSPNYQPPEAFQYGDRALATTSRAPRVSPSARTGRCPTCSATTSAVRRSPPTRAESRPPPRCTKLGARRATPPARSARTTNSPVRGNRPSLGFIFTAHAGTMARWAGSRHRIR